MALVRYIIHYSLTIHYPVIILNALFAIADCVATSFCVSVSIVCIGTISLHSTAFTLCILVYLAAPVDHKIGKKKINETT